MILPYEIILSLVVFILEIHTRISLVFILEIHTRISLVFIITTLNSFI